MFESRHLQLALCAASMDGLIEVGKVGKQEATNKSCERQQQRVCLLPVCRVASIPSFAFTSSETMVARRAFLCLVSFYTLSVNNSVL